MTFLDTNILVYAVDKNNVAKHDRARSIIAEAIVSPDFVISAQVINEFANVALLKLKLTVDEVRQFVSTFKRIRVVAVEPEWTECALDIKAQYGTQYFDSLLLAAADANRCDRFWTEDLNDGQTYGSVTAVNPFK